MALFRKIVFWLHLVAGVTCGLVIAIMAFTGAALSFESDLIAWSEDNVRHVISRDGIATRLSLNELLQRVRETQPDTRPTALTVSVDPAEAVAVTLDRDNVYYVNPYAGAFHRPASTWARDFMRLMERWHRFLGFAGETTRPAGKAVTGICTTAFLFLALSGLYLWWPRNWTWRGVKAVAMFNLRLSGKARDFNWHNSIGLWCAPVLIVLTLTALPISYRWANNFVYRLTRTEPPAQGAGLGTAVPAIVVSAPRAGEKPLSYDIHLANIQREAPQWTEITFRLGAARGGAGASSRPSMDESRERRAESTDRPRGPQAVNVIVRTADRWPLFSTTTFALDPFTGAVLRKETFADQNAGRRLRSWTRFLHTGEALGWPGKLVAALACLGALVLVWTGLSLAWRRLISRQIANRSDSSEVTLRS